MLKQFLDSGRYEEIDLSPLDRECRSNSIPQVILRYLPEATECPRCHSTHIRRKDLCKRTVIDMWGEKAVEVTITKQQYLCQNPECKKSFHTEDELDYPKEMQSKPIFSNIRTCPRPRSHPNSVSGVPWCRRL